MKKPENKKPESNNTKEYLPLTSYSVSRVKMWDNGGVTFDLHFTGITIYGCRVVELTKGDFIAFPQRKGSDGKYYSHVYVNLSEELQNAILAEVERQINANA